MPILAKRFQERVNSAIFFSCGLVDQSGDEEATHDEKIETMGQESVAKVPHTRDFGCNRCGPFGIGHTIAALS